MPGGYSLMRTWFGWRGGVFAFVFVSVSVVVSVVVAVEVELELEVAVEVVKELKNVGITARLELERSLACPSK